MADTRVTPQGPMTDEQVRTAFGFATLEPTGPVVAGSLGTWRLTYTVGGYGLDDGSTLMISWRFATDWGRPQFDDPRAPDYATVTTDGAAAVRARFDTKAGMRPWRKSIVIDVLDDGLAPGEQVILTLGETSGGSPGSRAQTFCEYTFEWRTQVNVFATGEFILLPDSPEIEIVSGPATRLIAIVPSLATVGEEIEVAVKAEDAWGNPAKSYAGTVRLEAAGLEGLPDEYDFAPEDAGIHRFAATVAAAGAIRVAASDETLGASARSNPLLASESTSAARVFWADPHGQ